MKLRTPLMALFGSLALGACDGGGPGGESRGVATVTGRYQASGGAASQGEAHLVTVDDEGRTQVVATGAIAADGTFRIEAPAGAGPYLVEVRAVGGADVLGQVIVPHGIRSGETISTLNIDAESRAEAAAYLAILAGEADREDVDAIGLIAWVNARLAAEAGSAASLGAAWIQAQEGWLRASARAGANVSARAVAELKAEAFKDFAAAGETSANAWVAFHQELRAALAARVSLEAQASADRSAALLGSAALSGRAGEVAADVGATLAAHSEWAAMAAASSSASADAQIAAAFEAYFEAVYEGRDVGEAQAALTARLTGMGSLAGDSALAVLASSQGVTTVQLRAAMTAAAGIRTTLATRLEAALSGAGANRVEGVVEAIVEARAAAQAHFAGALGASAAATASVASEAFVQAGLAEVLLDLDLFGTISAALRLEGTFDSEVSGAVRATLSTAEGTLVAVGEVGAGRWSFDGLAESDIQGALVVTLESASGAMVGGAILGELAMSGETLIASEAISQETTAQVRVMGELRGLGASAEEAVATARLEVEGHIAAAIADQEDARAAAASFFAAALVEARLRAEGSVEAAVATAGQVGSAVAARVGGAAEVAWRIEAKNRIEAALAVAAEARVGLTGSLFSSWRAEVEGAVEAFVEVAADAETAAEVDTAWQTLGEAMWGMDGLVLDLRTALSLDAVASGLFASAMAGAEAAAAKFEASIGAAVAGFDVAREGAFEALGAASAQASSTFASELAVALDLSFMTGVSALQREATADFMATVAMRLGASGSVGGMTP